MQVGDHFVIRNFDKDPENKCVLNSSSSHSLQSHQHVPGTGPNPYPHDSPGRLCSFQSHVKCEKRRLRGLE